MKKKCQHITYHSYHISWTLCTCYLTSIVHCQIEARLTDAAVSCKQQQLAFKALDDL